MTMLAFCPGCRPYDVLDPRTEMLEHCRDHPRPDLAGLDDTLATAGAKGPGMSEMTGEQTRAACDVIHRGMRT